MWCFQWDRKLLSPQAACCVLAEAGESFPHTLGGQMQAGSSLLACARLEGRGCTVEKLKGLRTRGEIETLTPAAVAVPAALPAARHQGIILSSQQCSWRRCEVPNNQLSCQQASPRRMRAGGERANGTHKQCPGGGECSRGR